MPEAVLCMASIIEGRAAAPGMGPVARGKPVRIRRGPAAVCGDETRRQATAARPWAGLEAWWEGAGSRAIREPEDLSSGRVHKSR